MTPLEHPRVLLVDDSDVILDCASTTLSDDCDIVGALKDGHAALEAVRALRPDVVVPADLVVAVNEALAGRRFVSKLR